MIFQQIFQILFFKAPKICIQKVTQSASIRIQKGKLNGRTLKASQVRDQPNLDKNFKSHIGYRDLQALRTSPDYLEGLRKNLFALDLLGNLDLLHFL